MEEADLIKYAALILNEKGEFLLGRKPGKDTWINIGGKPKRGETVIECLDRELKEEISTGIVIIPPPTYFTETPATPALDDPDMTVKIIWYKVKLLKEPVAKEELEEVKWFNKKNYKGYNLSPQIVEYLIPALLK